MIPFPFAPPPLPSPVSIVCHCFQLSERDILAAIRRGATSVPEVLDAANGGEGGCRGCSYSIGRMLQGFSPSAFHCSRCGGSAFLCGCDSPR